MTSKNTFHAAPCIKKYSAKDYWATVLTNSFSSANLTCAYRWNANAELAIEPAADNYPFIYLQQKGLSNLYLFSLSLVLFASLILIKLSGVAYRSIIKYFDLFLIDLNKPAIQPLLSVRILLARFSAGYWNISRW